MKSELVKHYTNVLLHPQENIEWRICEEYMLVRGVFIFGMKTTQKIYSVSQRKILIRY